jgi:hypothetical protein
MYGVLLSQTNTGSDAELACVFATPLSVTSNMPESISDTLNLRRIGSGQGVQRWEIQATIADSADGVDFFMLNITAGRSKKLYIRMPRLLRNTYTPSGQNPQSLANHGAGSTAISVTGMSNLQKGEFIQFATHSKVYAVAGYANGVISIFPALTAYVPIGTVIKYGDNVTLHAKLDDSAVVGITYEDGILARPGQYKFLEAL